MPRPHPTRRLATAAMALLVGPAALAALLPGAAHAATVTCGQVLTASVTLDNDLIDCPDDALIVGAHGITIDLNGHTIDGDLFAPPPQEPPEPPPVPDPPTEPPIEPVEPPEPARVGIVNDGFDNVVITNSSPTPAKIREFDHGVQLFTGTTANTVEKLTVELNVVNGIELTDADSGNQIRNNVIDRQAKDGIALLGGSTGNVVTANTISATTDRGLLIQGSNGNRVEGNTIHASAGRGVVLDGSTNTTVVSNVFTDNGGGALNVTLGSNNTLVEQNTISRAAGSVALLSDGIVVSGSTGGTIRTNTVHDGGGAGVRLTGGANTNTVRGNDVSRNSIGVAVNASSGNLVEANTANAGTGFGFELKDSTGNHVLANTANQNNSAGISVSGTAPAGQGNLIEANTANANKDGILTSGGGHTLTANTTNNNVSWGIKAAPGTIDGGGNVATGNGESAQCLGVVCTAAPPPPGTCAVVSAAADTDSWVNKADPTKNNGTDSVLKVTSKAPANDTRALIRFALPTAPAGCQVGDADLKLRSSGPAGRTIEMLQAAGAWTEAGVTWANQPATTGTAATAASGTGTITWDVTGQVQAMYGGTNNGFLVRDAAEGSPAGPEQQYNSREKVADNPPELVVTFVQCPSGGCPPPPPPPPPPAPSCGTLTGAADADSWVNEADPTKNLGTDSVLKVTSKAPAHDTRALVRFALPAIPAGCQVVGAELRLHSSGPVGRTIEVQQVGGAWTESAVTWNNQPAVTGQTATAPSGTGTTVWTVTGQVQAMYAGPNQGFLVRDAVEGGAGAEQQYNAREKGADNPPQLVITLGPSA